MASLTSAWTCVPELSHEPGDAQAASSPRFVVRTTTCTHSPGATVDEASHGSTLTPCLVVDADGAPDGSKGSPTGTDSGAGNVGQGKGIGDDDGDGAGDASAGDCAETVTADITNATAAMTAADRQPGPRVPDLRTGEHRR